MATAGKTHDITIEGTGLMLARDSRGTPLWDLKAYRTIPRREMSDAEYTYAQFPVEVALPWVETNWEYGIGGIDRTDTYKLASSVKIDGSTRGILKLARQFTLSTVDAVPAQYVPSGFCKSGMQMWAFIGDYPYTWDFTNKNWDRGTSLAGTTGPRMFRNGVEYAGSVYVPSWADDVGSGGSYVSADEPFRYIYKTLTATAWTQQVFSTTHPHGFKFLAVANSKLIGGYTTAETDSAATTSAAYNSSQTTMLVSDGTKFTAGDVMEIITAPDAGENELCLVVSINSNTLTVVRGYRGSVAVAHASAPKAIYKVTLKKHQIRTSTDGTTWSSPTNIGDSASPILGLYGVDWGTTSKVYIPKTDGLYVYDFTNVDKLESVTGHPNLGKAGVFWQGKLYLSRGSGGLYEIDVDTDDVRDVSFAALMPQQSQFHGEVVAMAAEPDAIYALVLDSANLKYHLIQGFVVAGNASISWHHVGAISYTTGTDANHAALCPDNVPNGTIVRQRIWGGMESTGSNLLPYFYPRPNDTDVVYTTDSDATIVSIKEDYGLINVQKRWDKIQVTTDNLTANIYLEAQYRIDGGSWSWFAATLGGTASQANSKIITDTATLYFPTGVNGLACEVSFNFITNTGVTSPELHHCLVTAQLRTDSPNSFPLLIDVRDGLRLLNGTIENMPKATLALLRTWRSQTDEVTLVDIAATSRTCIFFPEAYDEKLVGFTARHRPEYLVRCLLIQLT